MPGADEAPDADPEESIISMYRTCVSRFGWDLAAIDNTNFETLIDFICWRDPDTQMIAGKVYKRTTKPPAWL